MLILGFFNRPEQKEFTGRVLDPTFSKTMRRMWVQSATCGDPSLAADASPDGRAKAWRLYDLENRWVMVFDECDIHPERESERHIVDGERTYPLTQVLLSLIQVTVASLVVGGKGGKPYALAV